MSALTFILGLVKRAHPEAAPTIDLAIKLAPLIGDVAPVVGAAVRDGTDILQTVRRVAPDFTAALGAFVTKTCDKLPEAERVAVVKAVTTPHLLKPEEKAVIDRLAPTG